MDICSYLLAIVLLCTCVYKYMVESLLSVLLGIYLGVELLESIVILCLTCGKEHNFNYCYLFIL